MGSDLSKRVKLKVFKRTSWTIAANVYPNNEKKAPNAVYFKVDYLDYLRGRVLSLEKEFMKFLKPSDVIFDIQGLDDCLIEKICETERTNREQAARDLLRTIVDSADLLSKFLYALGANGYRRFTDPIYDLYPEEGMIFSQDYFDFIIRYLKGELIDILDVMPICSSLYASGCLQLSDKEEIYAIHSKRGKTAACKELFLAVRRKKIDWALLMVKAIKENQEYVKVKLDPSSTQEDLNRTGVSLQDSSEYHMDPTVHI